MDWRDKPIFEAGPLEGPSVYNAELMISDEYSGQNSMLDGGECVGYNTGSPTLCTSQGQNFFLRSYGDAELEPRSFSESSSTQSVRHSKKSSISSCSTMSVNGKLQVEDTTYFGTDRHCVPVETSVSNLHSCNWENCKASFANSRELKRHKKKHNPDEERWHCGCCNNVPGKEEGSYKVTTRRDHIRQHLKNVHHSNLEEVQKCKHPDCLGQNKYLFSSNSCLHLHESLCHGIPHVSDNERASEGLSRTISKLTDQDSGSAPFAQHDCHDKLRPSEYPNALHLIKPKVQSEDDLILKRGEFLSNTNLESNGGTSEYPTLLYPQIDTAKANEPSSMYSTSSYSSMAILSSSDTTLHGNPSFPNDTGVWPLNNCLNEYYSTDFPPRSPDWLSSAPLAADPLMDIQLWPFHGLLGLVEIPNIHPADFLAMYKIKGLQVIENLLLPAFEILQTANWDCISYDIHRETVVLRGDATDLQIAKDKLTTIANDFSKRSNYLQWLGEQARTAKDSTSRYPRRISSIPETRRDLNNIFVIRVKEDERFVTLWETVLLPYLPDLLDEFYLDKKYTANLVRKGESSRSAQPVIQIRSRQLLQPESQYNIQKAINIMCSNCRCQNIPVQFFQNQFKLLTGSISEEASPSNDERRIKFAYGRPWESPGMGASIGLRCTERVSATLGGYVMIENVKYILTTDHFIKASRNHERENEGAVTDLDRLDKDRKTLTSPSLADLIDMEGCLEQDVHASKANLKNDMLEKFKGIREISTRDLDKYEPGAQCPDPEELLDAIRKPQDSFVLGELAHQCVENRRASWPELSGSCSSHPCVKMDWALFKVSEQRAEGQNTHRYQSNDDAKEDDYSSRNRRRFSQGSPCQETCDILRNAKVHYVGQRSGRRGGTVNGVPMLSSDGPDRIHAWTIACDPRVSNSEMVEGDSGAWILTNKDNKLMGQLYGYTGDAVAFTSIHDIFADIKDTLQVEDVILPYNGCHRNPPMAESPTEMTCYITKAEPQKCKPLFSQCQPIAIKTSKPALVVNDTDLAMLGTSSESTQESLISTPSLLSSACSSPGSSVDHLNMLPSVGKGGTPEITLHDLQRLPKAESAISVTTNVKNHQLDLSDTESDNLTGLMTEIGGLSLGRNRYTDTLDRYYACPNDDALTQDELFQFRDMTSQDGMLNQPILMV